MELNDYLRAASKRERADVAVACNDSTNYLYQIAGGHRRASVYMALRIEAETRRVARGTGGRLAAVPCETLVRDPGVFDADAWAGRRAAG